MFCPQHDNVELVYCEHLIAFGKSREGPQCYSEIIRASSPSTDLEFMACGNKTASASFSKGLTAALTE